MKSLLIYSLLLFSLPVTAQFRWMESVSTANDQTKERFLGMCTGPGSEVFAAGIAAAAGGRALATI